MVRGPLAAAPQVVKRGIRWLSWPGPRAATRGQGGVPLRSSLSQLSRWRHAGWPTSWSVPAIGPTPPAVSLLWTGPKSKSFRFTFPASSLYC